MHGIARFVRSTYHPTANFRSIQALRVATRAEMGVTSLLACQREPQLTSIETHVLKYVVMAPLSHGNLRYKRPVSTCLQCRCSPLNQASSKAKTIKWQVVLQDTVIFPEGGGQPSDTGCLRIDDNTTSSKVTASSGIPMCWLTCLCIRQ